MKKILLTGGTGYIGSHCAVTFLEKGFEVVLLDNLSNSDIGTIENIEKITGKKIKFYNTDLRNKIDLEKIFKENNFYGVIHFAGLKAVGESCEKPFTYYENNIIGSLNLFELIDKFQVKNIIFSSSATVYDNFLQKAAFKEGDLVGNTTNPYGTTKFILENILRDLANHKNFRVINLRYFNPIGAHQSGLLGENPNGIPNNLLPFVMKVVTGELEFLKIFGGDYETKDGTGERDYIHISDLAEAHLNAFEFLEKNPEKNIYEEINIGTGKATSVLEIVKMTEEIVGKKVPYKIVEKRFGDVARLYCIPEKAKKILGWEAKKSIKQAIKDSINFIKNKKI